MRRIDFDPSKLTGGDRDWWNAWQERAEKATQAAIDDWENGRAISFNDGVWGDLKRWLLQNVFKNKCAYCETKTVRFPGHAEHYRPKGAVDIRDAARKARRVEVRWPDGTVKTHPGYFWLAYHWKNLVPSCDRCNSGEGKQNLFPVGKPGAHVLLPKLTRAEADSLATRARAAAKWRSLYYLDPDELDAREGPELLNPYADDPSAHLVFGQGGIVSARANSAKGVASIEVFGLEADDALRVERQKQQTRAYLLAVSSSMPLVNLGQAPWTDVPKVLAGFLSGEEAYSAAALDYVRAQLPLAPL